MRNIVFEKVMEEFGFIEDINNNQRPSVKKYTYQALSFFKHFDSPWQIHCKDEEFAIRTKDKLKDTEGSKRLLISAIVAYFNYEKGLDEPIEEKVNEIEKRINISLLNDPKTDLKTISFKDDIMFKEEIEKLVETTNMVVTENEEVNSDALNDKHLVLTDTTTLPSKKGLSYILSDDNISVYVRKSIDSHGHSREDMTYFEIDHKTDQEEFNLCYNCTKYDNSLKLLYTDSKNNLSINVEYDLVNDQMSQGQYPWLGRDLPTTQDKYFIKDMISKATKASKSLKEQIITSNKNKTFNKNKDN